MATQENPSPTITLFCWIIDVSDRPFLVGIDASATVTHLKEAILKKNLNTFVYSTHLWKVSGFIFGPTKLTVLSQDIHTDWYDSFFQERNSQTTVMIVFPRQDVNNVLLDQVDDKRGPKRTQIHKHAFKLSLDLRLINFESTPILPYTVFHPRR